MTRDLQRNGNAHCQCSGGQWQALDIPVSPAGSVGASDCCCNQRSPPETRTPTSSLRFPCRFQKPAPVWLRLVAQWKDIAGPTGEISIGTNKWNSFLNTITFGLFFKDTQTVTITAIQNSVLMICNSLRNCWYTMLRIDFPPINYERLAYLEKLIKFLEDNGIKEE